MLIPDVGLFLAGSQVGGALLKIGHGGTMAMNARAVPARPE